MNKKVISLILIIIGFILIGVGTCIFILPKDNTTDSNNNSNVESSNNSIDENISSFEKNDKPKDSNSYKKNNDGSFTNTSKKVLESHKTGDFEINNMTIFTSNGNNELANYSFTIKNNSSNNFNSVVVTITFKFADGTKSEEISSIADNLGANGSVEVKSNSLMRIIDAVDYDVKCEETKSLGVG